MARAGAHYLCPKAAFPLRRNQSLTIKRHLAKLHLLSYGCWHFKSSVEGWFPEKTLRLKSEQHIKQSQEKCLWLLGLPNPPPTLVFSGLQDQSEYRWAAQVAQWQQAGLPMQRMRDPGSRPGLEDPRSRTATHSSILASKSRGQRPGGLLSTGAKSQTVLSRHADPSTVAPGPKESFPFTRQSGQWTGSKHFILFYFNEIFIF